MTAQRKEPSGWIEQHRVALIRVVRSDNEEFRASGYLINSDTVLTAGHALDGAVSVSVEFFVGATSEPRRVESSTWWSGWDTFGIDIGVVRISGKSVRVGTPARIGRISRVDRKVTCGVAGFPSFKLRTRPEGAAGRDTSAFRELVRRDGQIMTLSNARTRTVEVAVDPPGQVVSRPWDGMSGAPIFVDGYVIGVVSDHYPGDGPGVLTGTLLAELFDALPAGELKKVCGWLGISTEPLDTINVLTLEDHEFADPPVDLPDRVARNLRTFGCRPVQDVPPVRVNLSRSKHRLAASERVIGLRFDKDFVYVEFIVKLVQGFPASVILTTRQMSIYDMYGHRLAIPYTKMRGVTYETTYRTVSNLDARDYQITVYELHLSTGSVETRDKRAVDIATTISRWLD
ncbi:serine protease [Luedemannella helvata]|uniref:Serine protease n=1 Tax=Luedemannella helvata TaxID=349315 RepID=A0ABP4VY72_9ACTN